MTEAGSDLKMEFEREKEEVLMGFLLDMGEKMLGAGGEISRVENMLNRIGRTFGILNMNIFAITSSISLTLEFPDGRSMTQIRQIDKVIGTDFSALEKINALSRRICAKKMSLTEAWSELADMEEAEQRGLSFYLGGMMAASGFCMFFGGSASDSLTAALFALLLSHAQRKLSGFFPNPILFNLLLSFCSGILICLTSNLIPELDANKIMIGDIMLLIPGIVVTNSMRDMLGGDTISGLLRLTEGILRTGALACGFMAAIWMTGI